jgi:hypothetical protein
MGAAIDKGVDGTALVAIDNDRGLAKIGRPKITRTRDFDVQREKAPGLAAKDAVLLLLIELGIVIERIGDPAIIERGPDRSGRSPTILGQGGALPQRILV